MTVRKKVRSAPPKMTEVRTTKEKVLNISLLSFTVGALRRGTLAHFPKTLRSAVSIGESSFKKKPTRVANPLAVKPSGGFNINIIRIMPDRRMTSKFAHNSNPTGITNGVLQLSLGNMPKLPGELTSGISDDALIRVKGPPKVSEVSKKKRQGTNTSKDTGRGPVLKETRKPTSFKEALPGAKRGVNSSMFIIKKMTRKNKSNGSVVRSKSLVKNQTENFTPKGKVLFFSAAHNSGAIGELFLNNARDNILPGGMCSTRPIVQDSVKNVVTVSKH